MVFTLAGDSTMISSLAMSFSIGGYHTEKAPEVKQDASPRRCRARPPARNASPGFREGLGRNLDNILI